jgi:DNA polymerase-3 subunit alpha
MPIADFVHLRVHTAYSMAEGAIQIKKLGKVCKEMAMPAVAITDTRNMFGGLEFSVTLAGEGVQPVIGCQVALRREDKPERGFGAREQVKAVDPDNIVLLCQNATGYANLIKLVSASFLDSDGHEVAQISMDDLERHAEGLILLTGGVGGPLGRLLLEDRTADAEAVLARLKQSFAGRL